MQKTLSVSTTKREEMINITAQVNKIVKESKIKDGMCIVYTPHTTAAITINESADPDVRHDVLMKLKELSDDSRYKHSEGNSDSHVKSSLIGCSETIIINNSSLLLGTWQAIFFCEFDGPRNRNVIVKAID